MSTASRLMQQTSLFILFFFLVSTNGTTKVTANCIVLYKTCCKLYNNNNTPQPNVIVKRSKIQGSPTRWGNKIRFIRQFAILGRDSAHLVRITSKHGRHCNSNFLALQTPSNKPRFRLHPLKSCRAKEFIFYYYKTKSNVTTLVIKTINFAVINRYKVFYPIRTSSSL